MASQIVHEALREKELESTVQAPRAPMQLNDDDRDPMIVLGENGLLCESSAPKLWAGVRANAATIDKSLYWEAEVETPCPSFCYETLSLETQQFPMRVPPSFKTGFVRWHRESGSFHRIGIVEFGHR